MELNSVIEVPCSECGKNPLPLPLESVNNRTHRVCKDCAKKTDTLGRPRAARERKSLSLDHHTLRINDERRGHRWPAGVIARAGDAPADQQDSDLRATQLLERLNAAHREALERRSWRRWAEAGVLDCPEFADLTPLERAVLKLFQKGGVRQIAEQLRAQGKKISKSSVANAVRQAIGKIRSRIETAQKSCQESPKLQSVLTVVYGDGDYDDFDPKGLADLEDSRIGQSLRVAGDDVAEEPAYQEKEMDDWDAEEVADHMLD